MSNPKPPPVQLAVDPSVIRSGFVFRVGTVAVIGAVDGLENLANCKLFNHQAAKVVLVIEFPKWKGHGADQVRAAANSWIRLARATWPRKVRVIKVRPDQWQNPLGLRIYKSKANPTPPKPAELYQPFCGKLLGIAPTVLPPDESAAMCILHAYDQGHIR